MVAVALAGLALSVAPRPAAAQGVRGLLRDIARAAGDSGSKSKGASAGRAAGGGAIRVVEQQVEGGDSLAQHVAPDTGITVVGAAGGCGSARACVSGWDLRVLRVALPGPLVPAGGRVVVTVEVDNRGREPAPPSELRLCFGEAGLLGASEHVGCGRDLLDAVALPALAPGARAVVRHAVELPVKGREVDHWTVIGEVDPERSPGARNRATNAARSGETATRLPALQFLAADASADGRLGAALPVSVRLRNSSTVATSPATELQLGGYQACGTGNWGGGPNRVAVPALAPHQSVTYRLLVPDAGRCRASGAVVEFRLDPDHRAPWGRGHEAEVRRTYSVR